MDETVSIDYPTEEAANEALRMVRAEAKEDLEASIERHGAKWRLTLHHDDGEDDVWVDTRLRTI